MTLYFARSKSMICVEMKCIVIMFFLLDNLFCNTYIVMQQDLLDYKITNIELKHLLVYNKVIRIILSVILLCGGR